MPVAGAGGVSAARSTPEGDHAQAWAMNIGSDILG
jgi:hypothetical protein